MPIEYLKEGDSETLKDGTLVEHTENGIIVHNTPKENAPKPRYSSIISSPTLNHTPKECRECAAFIAKRDNLNAFSIEDLLYAIEILHGCGNFVSHPWIELHADGSGKVIGRYQDVLFTFQSMREFISHANDLMRKMEPKEEIINDKNIQLTMDL